MIAICADFDPVHKGHEKLIKNACKLASKEDKKVVVYLNKGYSANHSPFFSSFNARREMALALGVDEVKSFEGLHHRLTLSYSVFIRLKQMMDDGVTDYITSASISLDDVKNKAQKFIDDGNFLGMDKGYANRNEIRWYGINEFLKTGINFHIVKELDKSKYSGRLIRQSIIDNDMIITPEVEKLLPKSSVDILWGEIASNNLNFTRDWESIYKKMNTYSRSNLSKIAYLNSACVNEIIKKRVYSNSESIWAVFRRSNYGPVMTRLAVSAIECDVSKKEVYDLMKYYESLNIIPNAQKVENVINRAWYVANSDDSKKANEEFRKGNVKVNSPLEIIAGLNLTRFETKIIKAGLSGDLYIDKKGKISVKIKANGKKIKTNLRLPRAEVTYLRYIMDSHFIPVNCEIIKSSNGFKAKIIIG